MLCPASFAAGGPVPPRSLSRIAVKWRGAQAPGRDWGEGIRVLPGFRQGGWFSLALPPGADAEALCREFVRKPEVAAAEPERLRWASLTPSDPLYLPDQWNLSTSVSAEPAWDRTDGTGVLVAVLDTGILMRTDGLGSEQPMHPELVAVADVNGGESSIANGMDDDGNGYVDDRIGWNALDGVGSGADDLGNCTDAFALWPPGHGTFVASVIAAAKDGAGMVGLAYGAKLLPVKVLGRVVDAGVTYCDSGTSGAIASGLDYARIRGAKIVNMSFGGPDSSQEEKEAMDRALDAGMVLVAAAGNDALNEPYFPANYLPVIAVSALDRNDKLASYSNFGQGLDFAAPGGTGDATPNAANAITGAVYDLSPTPTPGWGWAAGTSFAAPHVSALAALLWSQGWTDREGLRLRMAQTADDLGAQGWDDHFGYGKINADRATRLDANPGPNPYQGSDGGLGGIFAYPNPFDAGKDPHCLLTFGAKAGSMVKIRIFDAEDRKVWEKTVEGGAVGTRNEIVWDGRNGRGDRAGSGVYLLSVEQEGQRAFGKLALIAP